VSYLGQKHGYIEGLGAAFTLAVSEGLRSIQEDLQRLGLLDPGTGPTGADGRWGANTSVAIGTAAMRMGYTGAPVAVTNGGRNITIADDFIAALHRVAISGFPTTTVRAPDVSTTPSAALPTTVITPDVEEPWITPRTLIGGAVAVGAVAAIYMMWGSGSTTRNMRRFRRNARRRRR
jgi:hypothetical protein